MIAALLSYLRIMLFIAGTLTGLQFPHFVDQYGKSLEAHYRESRISLAEFQGEADKYFSGDIERLISHYKNSQDLVFQDGGLSIQSIYARNIKLKENLTVFRSSYLKGYWQAFLSPVPDVQQEVKEHFSFAAKLDPESILFGLVSGLFLTALIELMLLSLISSIQALLRKRQPA